MSPAFAIGVNPHLPLPPLCIFIALVLWMLSSTEMTGMKKLAIGSCAELHCRHCRSSEVFLPYAWLGAR